MGCSSSRPSDLPKPNAPLAAADVPPPFPFGHHLLVGLVRSLDLEHGPANEPGAVATWVTLELECRPTKDLVELNTDLKTCALHFEFELAKSDASTFRREEGL